MVRTASLSMISWISGARQVRFLSKKNLPAPRIEELTVVRITLEIVAVVVALLLLPVLPDHLATFTRPHNDLCIFPPNLLQAH